MEQEKREELERELAFQKARFDALAAVVPEIVFEMDRRGIVTFLNQRAFEISGYRPEDVSADFDATQLVVPAERERARLNLARLIEGEPSRPHEYTARRKDGSTFPGVTRSIPIFQDGELSRVLGTIADVSDQRRAQDALRVSEDLFHAAFETCPDAMIISTLEEGRLIDVNAGFCRLSGYSKEEVIGRSSLEIGGWETPEQRAAGVAVLRGGGHVENVEARFRLKDGSVRTGLLSAAAFEIAGELHALTIVRDIEEIKQAERERRALEAQVQQAQKLESLGLLAGGIAHDFNNLLMGLVGHAELALDDLQVEAPAHLHVEQVRSLALRGGELTEQLLAYAGRAASVVAPLDLNALVRETLPLLELTVAKSARLDLLLASELPSVEADTAQLRQVLVNLVINASEALGVNGGTVAIRTAALPHPGSGLGRTRSWLPDPLPSGGIVLLEVQDSGAGMDAETQERMFDPFFSTKFAGRGLGLAALLGIVRSHSGAVLVESAPGEGTRVGVLLPAGQRPAEHRAGAPLNAAWRGRGLVLVVDDDRAVRDVAQIMLKRAGFTVATAPDGERAVEAFLRQPDAFACMLLDLTMPGMDGEEVLRAVRARRAGLPVVLISGHPESEVAPRFADQARLGFLQKPFSKQALLDMLRGLLGT